MTRRCFGERFRRTGHNRLLVFGVHLLSSNWWGQRQLTTQHALRISQKVTSFLQLLILLVNQAQGPFEYRWAKIDHSKSTTREEVVVNISEVVDLDKHREERDSAAKLRRAFNLLCRNGTPWHRQRKTTARSKGRAGFQECEAKRVKRSGKDEDAESAEAKAIDWFVCNWFVQR